MEPHGAGRGAMLNVTIAVERWRELDTVHVAVSEASGESAHGKVAARCKPYRQSGRFRERISSMGPRRCRQWAMVASAILIEGAYRDEGSPQSGASVQGRSRPRGFLRSAPSPRSAASTVCTAIRSQVRAYKEQLLGSATWVSASDRSNGGAVCGTWSGPEYEDRGVDRGTRLLTQGA